MVREASWGGGDSSSVLKVIGELAGAGSGPWVVPEGAAGQRLPEAAGQGLLREQGVLGVEGGKLQSWVWLSYWEGSYSSRLGQLAFASVV